MDRIIIHVDMDAFFASVEVMDNPSLKGKPVIVCGLGERGVVSTCSYEARRYGVHSAMPVFMAVKKCPMGEFIPVRMSRYKEISSKIFDIFREYTEKIEPLSIDEAFLDLTNTEFNDGIEVANSIKDRVRSELGLTLSVGVSYNKFLAKLASDWNKPNGIKVITKDMIPDILFPLNINKVFGIGKKTVSKLNNIGIFTIKDLYEMPQELYMEYMGKMGIDIYNRIRGIDNREVRVSRERKSIGKETTFKSDIVDKKELLEYLLKFSREINNILSVKDIKGKTITLKYKTASFENHTRSKTFNHYISSAEEIYNISKDLLESAELQEPLRLIGISVSSFRETESDQITFF